MRNAPEGWGTDAQAALLHDIASGGLSSLRARELLDRVARAAAIAAGADGAFVERLDADLAHVEVEAAWGEHVPRPGERFPFAGSAAESVVRSGRVSLVEGRSPAGGHSQERGSDVCEDCNALVIPLLSDEDPIGAMVLLRSDRRRAFTRDDADRLTALADLAVLAVERTLLFQESDARRRALEESEERFRLLVEGVADYAIFMLDTEGRIRSWNRGAERINGYTEAEALGRHFSIFYTEEDRRRDHPRHELEVAAAEGSYQEEGFRVRRDGTRFWSHVLITAIRDPRGRLLGFSKVTRDLSERERLAEARRREAERYRTIYEDNPAIYLTMDSSGAMVDVNRFGAEYLGYSEDDLVGRPAIELVCEDDRLAFREHFRACLARPGDLHRLEFRKMHRDGHLIWVRETARAIRDSDGELVVLSVCEDVTERKRVEDTYRVLDEAGRVLASSLDFEQTLRNTARLAVALLGDWCVIDLCEDGEIQRVAVEVGDPRKVSLTEEYVRRFPPDPDAPSGGPRVIRTGEAEIVPEIPEELLRSVSKDADQFRILKALGLRSAISVPLRVEERVLGAITLVSARSDRRYGRDDLRLAQLLADRAALSVENARLYREAQAASQVRDEVLSIVSHDLRNPLNTILLSASFLADTLEEGPHAPVLKQIRIIQRAARHGARLISDLLDSARLETGRLPLEVEVHDPRVLVLEACDSLRPLVEEKRIELHCGAGEQLPSVLADRERVIQLFGNLIGNAIRFTPEGGRIEVAVRRDGGCVRFSVGDTGTGIPAEDLPHLFDRFHQAKQTRRGGTGLGLGISRGIVESHGGRIWVESTEGEGSTFSFTIPVA
jgi:PAS domain S-box-containing protein